MSLSKKEVELGGWIIIQNASDISIVQAKRWYSKNTDNSVLIDCTIWTQISPLLTQSNAAVKISIHVRLFHKLILKYWPRWKE